MTIKKRTYIIALVVILSLFVSFLIIRLIYDKPMMHNDKPMMHGDWPYYPNVESITEKADLIIIGDVVSAKSVERIMIGGNQTKDPDEGTPYTISTVKVSRVIKGDVNIGDIIPVRQLGDFKNLPESTLQSINGYLSKDEECLMFLAEFDDLPYTPLNPGQGVIQILEGTTLHSNYEFALFGYNNSKQPTNSEDISAIDQSVSVENSKKFSVDTAIAEISKYVN